jgi:hypothetical protein
MRQPIYYSDIRERIRFKEEGMKDLETRAHAYAKVGRLWGGKVPEGAAGSVGAWGGLPSGVGQHEGAIPPRGGEAGSASGKLPGVYFA